MKRDIIEFGVQSLNELSLFKVYKKLMIRINNKSKKQII